MSSYSWKHHFYAFLLRRALGSILTAQSAAELRSSIQDVDWTEGKLVLADVELDAHYLTALIIGSPSDRDEECDDENPSPLLSNLSIQRAKIRRLGIHFSLSENNTNNGESASMSSTARKATSALIRNIFGSFDEHSASIALVVHVELDGVDIEVAPCRRSDKKHSTKPINTQPKDDASTRSHLNAGQDEAAPGFLSSMIDSAIKSLRLSIDVNDVTIRSTSQENWMTIKLASAQYYDLIDCSSNSNNNNNTAATVEVENLVLSKAIDWDGFTVEICRLGAAAHAFLQTTGDGHVKFHFFERQEVESSIKLGRREIRISLGQHVAVDLDTSALTQLLSISDAFTTNPPEQFESDLGENDPTETTEYSTPKLALTDEFTREAYDEVMKQYTEARHLARTREIRGGVLIPSLEVDDEGGPGEISFDAFFDANDHSVSYYCDLVDDSWADGSVTQKGKQHVHEISTKIDFGMSEFTFKLRGEPDHSTTDMAPEFILISMGDLQFIVFESGGEKKINSSISHFEIESQVLVGTSVVNESMLRFNTDSETTGDLLVSSPPCISAYVELSKVADDKSCKVDLVLQPVEVVYRNRAMACVTNLTSVFSDTKRQPKLDEPSGNTATHVSLSCGSVALLMPCSIAVEADSLFARCSYTNIEEQLKPFFGLGLEIDNISADFSNKSDDDTKAVARFSHAVVFAKSTKIESARGRRRFASSYVSRRVDLIACTADQDRASDSLIVLSYTHINRTKDQQGRKKSNFSMILPLSSMKARQQDDDSDAEDFFDEVIQSPGSKHEHTTTFKSTDPQYIMSSEACEAENELTVSIPHIYFDVTLDERQQLMSILSDISKVQPSRSKSNAKVNSLQRKEARTWTSAAFNVGQLSVVLYDHIQMPYSYSVICDDMRVHTLLDSMSGVRNSRISSADVTLYELSDSNGLSNTYQEIDPSQHVDRCKRLQERMVLKKRFSQSKAIFFRSKLSQPLAPEHPAVLIDIILRNSQDESHLDSPSVCFDEKCVHICLYDITYRYYVGSEWFQNLSRLIKGRDGDQKNLDTATREEATESLTNLFVSATDCNFDYTSPATYGTPSRSILRIGEVQLSTNLLSPLVKVQSFKVSLSELGLNVCNYRRSYNDENALLSCAHRHFSEDHISVNDSRITKNSMATFISTLSYMDFINVVSIDSIDAAILVNTSGDENQPSYEPATTIALTLGKLNGNFCKDSFSCLANTFNDWLLRFLAISEEELEKLRLLSESKDEDGALPLISNGSNGGKASPSLDNSSQSKKPEPKATPSGIFREESASVDLTETLLFQDYYTIDATKNSRPSRRQPAAHPVRTVVESSSSDEEWAAVEHEYLRNSSIPREVEQRAEWVLCENDESDAFSQSQCKTIKVFPQHFRSKPLLDSLSERHADSAKLTGTHESASVGLRLIVKDASISCRFFDGLDWAPTLPVAKPKADTSDRKRVLLSNLLDDNNESPSSTLVPLPDERSEILKRDHDKKRLRRNVHRYFSISIGGLALNQDSYVQSTEHQLASSLNLSVADFFVAETISSKDPIKMVGEWINEEEHPRDNSDGVIMLEMMTSHPTLRVSSDGKLMSDESQTTLELLPLRCFVHQPAIRFIRGFFSGEDTVGNDGSDEDVNSGDDLEMMPVFFTSFKIKAAKLKVDYTPEKMDVDSFREGNYVEILNLCPLEDMVLTLKAVENHDLTGWGQVFGELASRWIEDVGKTQSHKFFTRATPVQFFSSVTESAAELAVVLLIPESGSFANYLKDVLYSSTSFASKLACETLTTSAKLTRYAANQVSKDLLPRPKTVPRHVGDAAGHSVESISRGLRQANYKIITVPLREYQQSGASGAARSAVKGLPIAVLAPLSGASEALSYTLLGLRNSLRPDLRKEAENSLRGLNFE
ncbi:hypothetical protein ACHAXN_010012 [Cyclotella atomus]